MKALDAARAVALGAPLMLLVGALGSQYLGGLYPCEMCHWQRWPHYAAVPLGLLAIVTRGRPLSAILLALATVAILVSGLIGGFHAGVEYGWWEGVTGCATTAAGGSSSLSDILNAPVIRCDQAQWSLAGISLAGFNALFSFAAAVTIIALVNKARRA